MFLERIIGGARDRAESLDASPRLGDQDRAGTPRKFRRERPDGVGGRLGFQEQPHRLPDVGWREPIHPVDEQRHDSAALGVMVALEFRERLEGRHRPSGSERGNPHVVRLGQLPRPHQGLLGPAFVHVRDEQ